jgi:soluble lytic murein transglycosylase-like protein
MIDIQTQTLNLTEMIESRASSVASFISKIKVRYANLIGPVAVVGAFILATLSMGQPLMICQAAWMLPEEVYEVLQNTKSVPSIADEAAKIPTKLVDGEAIDHTVLRTYAEKQSVAKYLADKYKMDQAASYDFVEKAMVVSREVGLDPTLILAVTAVESGFNPLAESKKGAQGLMQVMTRVHAEKFELFGGHEAALDPNANMRVGSLILREYIAKGGSLQAGLRLYVGASSMIINDGGYGEKVLAERQRLREAAGYKLAMLKKSRTI